MYLHFVWFKVHEMVTFGSFCHFGDVFLYLIKLNRADQNCVGGYYMQVKVRHVTTCLRLLESQGCDRVGHHLHTGVVVIH